MLKLASTTIFTMPAIRSCPAASPALIAAALLHERIDRRGDVLRHELVRSGSTSTRASSSFDRNRNSSSAAGTGVSRVTTNWQKSPEWCDCASSLMPRSGGK